MAASYGFDISGPARTAREAVQWLVLRLPRRGEGTERRGDVARPLLDVPRHLLRARPRGRPADRGAGAGDHRRLRHQAPHRPLPAHAGVRRAVRRRPDLGDRVDRRDGRRRPLARDQDELPDAADALQPRARRRSPTSPSGTRARMPDGFRQFAAKVAIDTSSLQFESDEIMRRDLGRRRRRSPAACRRCWSASRCSSSARAPTWPSACSTPSTAAATR